MQIFSVFGTAPTLVVNIKHSKGVANMIHRQKRRLTEVKLAVEENVTILWNMDNKVEFIVRRPDTEDLIHTLDEEPLELTSAIVQAQDLIPLYS